MFFLEFVALVKLGSMRSYIKKIYNSRMNGHAVYCIY